MRTIGDRFWQLKESAKWSLDMNERRQAIEELAGSYGKEALQAILEIKDVTAYDEIRKACAEAIKEARKVSENPPRRIKRSGASRKPRKSKTRRK
ncbi:MAG: hypothetical protein ACREAQ_07550 [Nitrososphaera sp.]